MSPHNKTRGKPLSFKKNWNCEAPSYHDPMVISLCSSRYGVYKENFRSHFITGMKLMTLDACTLPKIGVQHFPDILSLCRLIRDQLHIKVITVHTPAPRIPLWDNIFRMTYTPGLSFALFIYRFFVCCDSDI